jgi:hypothetical protein
MNCKKSGIKLCPNCETEPENTTSNFICWISWYHSGLDEWTKNNNVKENPTLMLTKVEWFDKMLVLI